LKILLYANKIRYTSIFYKVLPKSQKYYTGRDKQRQTDQITPQAQVNQYHLALEEKRTIININEQVKLFDIKLKRAWSARVCVPVRFFK
jgi:hypothetical protein